MSKRAILRFRHHLWGLALASVCLSQHAWASNPKLASQRQDVNAVIKKAKEALKANELPTAAQLFKAANKLDQNPRTLRLLATTQGRLGEVGPAFRNATLALSLLKEIEKPTKLDQAELTLTQRLRSELEPRCAFIRVAFAASVINKDSQLKINDRAIERDRWSLRHAVTPGEVKVELAGHPIQNVQAKAGRVEGVEFKPIAWATEVVTAPPTSNAKKNEPTQTSSDSWRTLPILPLAALGLGGALFITGGVASIRTSVVAADLEERCGSTCYDTVLDANERRQGLAVAGLVLGTGFIATGMVTLLLRKRSAKEKKTGAAILTPIISPRMLGFRARY